MQFSFISFSFFLFWCYCGETLNLGLCSQHSLPPLSSVHAIPPHLPIFPPLYAIWFMISMNIAVLFRGKKEHFFFWSKSSVHCTTLHFHPSTRVIVQSLFSQSICPFLILYFSGFSWECFYQCWYLCQLPLHFQSPFPSVRSLERYVLFFISLLCAHFSQVPLHKHCSCCNF